MTRISTWLAFIVLAFAPSAYAQPSPDAIGREMLARVATAWAATDAAAIAALYASDGDLIVPSGTRLAGREAVRAFYGQAFGNGYADSRAKAELRAMRALTPDILVGDGSWSINGAARPDGSPRAREEGRFTVILKRAAAGWEIAALREYVAAR